MSTRSAGQPFGPAFWCAYAANTLLMVAVSLMFRYADFITHLGGTEYELGWIVGIGMVGGVAMRALQGVGIDRYGAMNVWLISSVGVIASLLAHVGITELAGGAVYFWRVAYTCSLAGAFGASIVFVSLRSPADRLAETIGGLGSSGFVGMAIGPWVADRLFATAGTGRDAVELMFYWAAAASGLALLATVAGAWTAGEPPRNAARAKRPRRRPPLGWLLRRYHPGPILWVGIGMGLGIGIPFYFVRPFCESLGVPGIRTFFTTYAGVAFLARVAFRRWPDRWGARRTVLLGMSFLGLHLLAFLPVRNELGLLLPATLGGIAHAFVFPAAMAAASHAFPARHRGLATAWMLTMIDLGNLVGQPAVGSVLLLAARAGWPAYPTMFVTMASVLFLTTWLYARQRTSAHRRPPLRDTASRQAGRSRQHFERGERVREGTRRLGASCSLTDDHPTLSS